MSKQSLRVIVLKKFTQFVVVNKLELQQ